MVQTSLLTAPVLACLFAGTACQLLPTLQQSQCLASFLANVSTSHFGDVCDVLSLNFEDDPLAICDVDACVTAAASLTSNSSCGYDFEAGERLHL